MIKNILNQCRNRGLIRLKIRKMPRLFSGHSEIFIHIFYSSLYLSFILRLTIYCCPMEKRDATSQ
jgi:hypothetical protein